MSSRSIATVSAAMLLLSSLAGSSAYAEEASPQEQAVVSEVEPFADHARQWMNEYGVAADVQDRIIAKISNGELPDSDAGVPAISSEIRRNANHDVAIATFPDGSISVSRVSLPNEGLSNSPFRGIKGCVRSGGSLINCTAEYSTVLGYSSFMYDRTAPTSGVGQIRNLRAWRVSSYAPLTSVSNQRLEIISSTQGRLSWNLSVLKGGGSSSQYLQVNLGRNGSAWVTAA